LAKLTGLQVIQFPTVLGNRAVAEVAAVGSGVDRFKPGDLVLSYTAHAEFVKATPALIPSTLPPDLDFPESALLGMALVSLGGVRVAEPALGDIALVTGGGLVGQLAAQLLQASGATVILSDPVAFRRARASECGIVHTANPDDLPALVDALTDGAGVDLVLECTGAPAVVLQVLPLCRQSSTVVLTGSPRGECQANLTELLNSVHLCRPHGDITLKGAHEWKYPVHQTSFVRHSHQRNVEALVGLVQRGQLQLKPLLSGVFSPREAAAAYSSLLGNAEQGLGVVFDWRHA
jgi:threonine dehydrogenase-like Zn-dependent dehydrogenase